MKFQLLLFCLYFCTIARAQSIEDLPTRLLEVLQQEKLTGATWSIVEGNQISTGAIGLANANTNEHLKVESKVQIGSITKTLIATGILRLVSQNQLDLDRPVEQLILDIVFDNPWKNIRRVTVRDLLNHTSGLEDAEFWQVFSKNPEPLTPLLEVFSKDRDVLKVRTKPGSRFSYSNMGYTMLGLVIEKVTGEPYETYLDANLLGPLGMVNSTFRFISQRENPDMAMGHFDDGSTQPSIPMYLRPAGQFSTTAYDMALFGKFLMSDGLIDGRSFIQTGLLREMGNPKTTESFQFGLSSGYQFGLSYRDRYGVIGYYHSGNIIGHRATFYLFPEQQKAFFISINMDSESADYQKLNKIFVEYLEVSRPDIGEPGGAPSVDLASLEGYYQLNPVRFELFAYVDLLFNHIKISFEKDANKLKISSVQNDSYDLFPLEGNLFRKGDRVSASHVIYRHANKTLITDGLATYEKISPYYLGLIWLSLGLGVLAMLTILGRGIYKFFQKKLFRENLELAIPFLSIIFLFIPIPFFFFQSFIELGDLTVANLLLTIVTGILPFALIFGIIMSFKRTSNLKMLDLFAIVLLFQWTIILMYWGLMPFKFWVW